MSPAPFPDSTVRDERGLVVGGCALTDLADRYGTPLYVYDDATLRSRATAAVAAVAAAPNGGTAAFALKACPVPGVLRVLSEVGMGADCASAGEIAAALRGGFSGRDLVVHGNAKTDDDLAAAIAADARLIVLDNADEATRLSAHCRAVGRTQDVLIRVAPGVEVDTHAKIATGHHGSKFGLPPGAAADLASALPDGLRLRGLHLHLGSQITATEPLREAAALVPRLAADHGVPLEIADVGGGLGIPYLPGDPAPNLGAHVKEQIDALITACDHYGVTPPQVIVEPGRAVVGTAGITLYRVVAVKTAGDGTRMVAVDGGMGDNLRVGLYDARYGPVLAARPDAADDDVVPVDIVGRHCETTDVIAEDVPLPPVHVGDVVAVPATGAYHQSMAVPYNLFGRPAAVLVTHGNATEITRRETVDDLLARER